MSRTLAEWLAWQQTLHPRTIDLGLERLSLVLAKLGWQQPKCPVIIVGGTNGKGSCVALLESILAAAGYRVGTFTSPHLIRYNERIRIAGQEISDAALVDAFERIDAARGDTSLTFFEFNTLAALLAFGAAELDVVVLEVGLGGRLDAVNIVDPDVALLCSVALDHCEWLGADVESIGREKAGIFRANRAAVFGSYSMPQSVAAEAKRIGARLLRLGEHFEFTENGESWSWRGADREYAQLPRPGLFGAAQFENASAVFQVLDELNPLLPVSRAAVDRGLRDVRLPGRFQSAMLNGRRWIFDVAHNPAAAGVLSENLRAHAIAERTGSHTSGAATGRTIAVCGMFADKDVDGVIGAVRDSIDVWIVAGVGGERGMAPAVLADKLAATSAAVATTCDDVPTACEIALSMSQPGDRVVIFGSFYAVGPALEWWASRR